MLSTVIAESLALAIECGKEALAEFCRRELRGWNSETQETMRSSAPYRFIKAFISYRGKIDAVYGGARDRTSVDKLMAFIDQNPSDFGKVPFFVPDPIGVLEEKAAASPKDWVAVITMRVRDLSPDLPQPDAPLYAYGEADFYGNLLRRIMTEWLKKILS